MLGVHAGHSISGTLALALVSGLDSISWTDSGRDHSNFQFVEIGVH